MTAKLPGILVVLSGPSGVGKTTVAGKLLQRPGYRRSVSVTTRPMRAGEVDGQDYHFVSRAAFDALCRNGELIEHAEVHGNFYGTPKQPLRDAIEANEVLLLVIDVAGGEQVQAQRLDALLIFLVPPDSAELARRLGARATEDVRQQTMRLRHAEIEMEKALALYDHNVVNADLGQCVSEVDRLITQARRRLQQRREDGETLYPGLHVKMESIE